VHYPATWQAQTLPYGGYTMEEIRTSTASWKDEEAELAAVDARESARAALTDAESRWRPYLANSTFTY
jgi:hypothetical protein